MVENVLLLGANGFIGRKILNVAESKYRIIPVKRDLQQKQAFLEEVRPVAIINCAASEHQAGYDESYFVNIDYPLKWLEALERIPKLGVKWIQAASYFELQIPFGRIDHYSIHKMEFRTKFLSAKKSQRFEPTAVFLPHIFGDGQKPNALFPSLIRHLKEGDVLNLTTGRQYLPLLHVDDAANALIESIHSNQETCSAYPIWYGTVLELILEIESLSNLRITPNSMSRVSDDEKFPRVSFPSAVDGWNASISVGKYLESIFRKN